jgi:hypothetical protein
MRNLIRFASWLCGATSLLLLASLVASALTGKPGSIDFAQSKYHFDKPLTSSLDYNLEAVVVNTSKRKVTLLGASGFCNPYGCCDMAGLPRVIEPGTECRVNLHFQAGDPGPFDLELPIFTDFPSQPHLLLRFDGVVANDAPTS